MWNNASLIFPSENITATTSDIKGNPFGIHIYKVNELPSQKSGLPLSVHSPYFGIFIAANDIDNSFDASYIFNGNTSCKTFTREDNSKSTWTDHQTNLDEVIQRIEIIKIPDEEETKIDLGIDKVLCNQTSINLNTDLDPSGKSIIWSNGQKTPSITVTESGVIG